MGVMVASDRAGADAIGSHPRSRAMLDDGSIRFLLSVPPLDIAALAWFFLLWAGYNLIVDWILQRPLGLNQHMGLVRGA